MIRRLSHVNKKVNQRPRRPLQEEISQLRERTYLKEIDECLENKKVDEDSHLIYASLGEEKEPLQKNYIFPSDDKARKSREEEYAREIEELLDKREIKKPISLQKDIVKIERELICCENGDLEEDYVASEAEVLHRLGMHVGDIIDPDEIPYEN